MKIYNLVSTILILILITYIALFIVLSKIGKTTLTLHPEIIKLDTNECEKQLEAFTLGINCSNDIYEIVFEMNKQTDEQEILQNGDKYIGLIELDDERGYKIHLLKDTVEIIYTNIELEDDKLLINNVNIINFIDNNYIKTKHDSVILQIPNSN